ncbi:hypothetical protein IWW56_001370 [Coemansia sp. RSA 2131]|nr:hypothetical protein IWW56_001370 [Coemansia sp. RSA 2131]
MPAAGEGQIDCHILAGRIHQTVSSAYPLKIISPTATRCTLEDGTRTPLVPAVSYILSYGGGIVHGDQIRVRVRVATQCALLLLTQGSTKVYRTRGVPKSCLPNLSPTLDANQTYQTMEITVDDGALLCLLPDPVTCFKGAKYNQRQWVKMHKRGSLVLLDWMTSGRMSRGERWAFDKYMSVNCVSVVDAGVDADKGRLAVRDALLLESPECGPRLESLDAFAYLLILGPYVAHVADTFRSDHKQHRIRPFERTHTSVQWSVSEVAAFGVLGVAVRASSSSTEDLKLWIQSKLSGVCSVVGDSAWSMYCNT